MSSSKFWGIMSHLSLVYLHVILLLLHPSTSSQVTLMTVESVAWEIWVLSESCDADIYTSEFLIFPSSGQIFPIRRAVPTPAIPLRCQTLPVPSVWEEICPQWPPVKTCQSPPFSTHQPHSPLPKLTDIWEHRAGWHHHWATWTTVQGWIYLVSMEETAPSDLYHKRD